MMTADLSQRRLVPELMDSEAVAYSEFAQCLRHIAVINRWTLAWRPTLLWLDRLCRRHPTVRHLRIIDIGSGYGDMLRYIGRWATRRGVTVDLVGVDLNPWAGQAAAEAGRAGDPAGGPAIAWRTADVFSLPAGEVADVVVSSLFTHHLDDDGVVRFLRWMEERARLGWFVNDLRRHSIPHAVARAAAACLPVNRLVAHDAPVSVARAFTVADWAGFLADAGLGAVARIEPRMPYRLCVGHIKPAKP
jgi:SAM-dependent methyltransferase